MSAPDSDRRLALLLALFAACLYLLVANWVPEDADTEVAFQTTRGLALRGELHLAPETPPARRILEFAKTSPDGGAWNCRPGTNGLQYTYWGLAYLFAGVPFYWAGHALDAALPGAAERFSAQSFTAEGIPGSEFFARVAVMSLQPLCTAAALAVVFLAARRLGASRGASVGAALLLGFATSLGVQARSGLSDMQAVFLTALALERALAARESGRARDLVVTGAVAGLALLTKVHTLAAAPALALAVALPLSRAVRSLGLVAAGTLPFVLLFLGANWARWGDPLITGYEKSTAQPWFTIPLHLGFPALLFAPAKGVIVYAFPLVIAGIAGLVMLWRHGRRLDASVLALFAIGLMALPARTIEWHGAWSFGPRYALLAFPALAIAGAAAIDAATPRLRLALAALGVVGFAVVLPGFLTSPFAAIAIATEGARTQWPDSRFPPTYAPADRDAQRFQDLCFEAGPLNFLRVQHALARAAFAGRTGLRAREDLGLERDGTIEPPNQVEYRGFGSIGWIGYRARGGGLLALAVPALLALGALAAALRLARALGENPPGR